MYLPTVSHLRFVDFETLLFPGSSNDPLPFMLRALDAAVACPETLEHFTLRLTVASGFSTSEVLAGYSGWIILDTTLSRTTPNRRFSRLRKVDIDIHFAHNDLLSDQSLHLIRTLVSARMPSLHEKGVLAIEVILGDDD